MAVLLYPRPRLCFILRVMVLLPILCYPDPRLRQKAEPVTDFGPGLAALLDDLASTMYSANGIGLAATQVGVMSRIAVVDVSDDGGSLLELINPEVSSPSGRRSSEEGCLSIPDYRDSVTRSEKIHVRALDRNGTPFGFEAEGLLAVCVQHEVDHLDGILFVDRLSRLKREIFTRWAARRP